MLVAHQTAPSWCQAAYPKRATASLAPRPVYLKGCASISHDRRCLRIGAQASDKGTAETLATDEAASADSAAESNGVVKSDAYSKTMQAQMGGSLQYRHELGINFHQILPDLYVGSCMQTAADVERVHKELGVGTILCLQKDSDMAYFQLDIKPIQSKCRELGIRHVRFEIRDFDPYDLRKRLPDAVKVCCEANTDTRGPIYIHCTAGLGRAPAVAMAWMHWCKGYNLNEAVKRLTSIRACNPKVQSIRQATVDVLYGESAVPVKLSVTPDAIQKALMSVRLQNGDSSGGGADGNGAAKTAVQPLVPKEVKVAGLDVGWGQFLPLTPDGDTGTYSLTRSIPPGKYQYKFVVDDVWCVDDANPTFVDGDNTNNMLEVVPQGEPDPTIEAAKQRILSADGDLTAEERVRMCAAVCHPRPWWQRLWAKFRGIS